MLQLLYLLHKTPMVVSAAEFILFFGPYWDRSPRIRFEQLERPKDNGGIALPNP